MFTTDSGLCGYSCPLCDCGSYELNDTWYVEYGADDGEAMCKQCICTKDEYNNSYANCDYGVSYAVDDATCDANTGVVYNGDVTQCHNEYSLSGLVLILFLGIISIIGNNC